MTDKTLRYRPTASAMELHRFLSTLPSKISLNLHQDEALKKDIKTLESLIAILTIASSIDDWRKAWSAVKDMNRNFGGYVGDELGENLNQMLDVLWENIFDSYSEATK